jgi:hypothetical protein
MDRRVTRPASVSALLLAVASLAGCGHPASREECGVIFDKSAELELRAQRVTDPVLVEERVAAVRAARGEELIGKCVGRRITDRAMACVKASQTDDEMDRCLQ